MTGQKNRPGSGRGGGNEEFPDDGTDIAAPNVGALGPRGYEEPPDDIDNTAVNFNDSKPKPPLRGAKTVIDMPPMGPVAQPQARPSAPPISGLPPRGPQGRGHVDVGPTSVGIVAPPRGRDFDPDGPTRTFEMPPPSAPPIESRTPTGASRAALAQGVGTGPRPMTMRSNAVPARVKATKEDPFGLIGTALERRFRIDRLVAEGGYGAVYHGVHLTLDRPIALKVLKNPPGLEGEARREFMDKFVAEAKVIARLNHSAIVQVLDTDVSVMPTGEPAPWMALEWLEGRTLEDLQKERQGVPYAQSDAVRILRPVLEALAFAHQRGIAHRDVKPGNIMVVPEGASAQVKLLDFGIAKVMQPNEEAATSVTRNAQVNYSPHYAAPEQVAGMRSGPWSDVHAVALVLTELLIGQAAYRGNDLSELMSVALNPVRPTPRALGVDVGAVEAVLEKAMAFKASDRYQNMREMIIALDAVIPATESSGIIASGLMRAPDLSAMGFAAQLQQPAGWAPPPQFPQQPAFAQPMGAPSAAYPAVSGPQTVAPAPYQQAHTAMLPVGAPRKAPSGGPSILLWIIAGLAVVVASAGVVALLMR